jgi:hypothetical protein
MAHRERARNRSRIASLKKPTSWEGWAAVIAVPIAVAFGVISLIGGGGSDGPPAPSLAHVEPVDLVVHNDRFVDPPPRLEILLHNTGGQRAVLSRAKIEIRRVGSLRQCVSQGDLPLSTTYAATLPADASPGDVVEAPLHQQLGADEADRFAIALGVRAAPRSSRYTSRGRESLPGPYLFELAISLVSDEGGRPLDVGSALVSVPFAPDAPVFYWDRASEGRLVRYDRAQERTAEELGQAPPWPPPYTSKCWLSNTRTLRSMLSSNAKRSPTLEAVGSSIITPDMSLFSTSSN